MATTALWAVKSRLDHLVNYASNPDKTTGLDAAINYMSQDEKTIKKRYVSYINCSFDDPKTSMVNTKKHFNDKSEILAFHGYQSFEEDEVDADLAHQIGVEYAQKMWGDRFEVIVSTHLDTDNIHNHFLINSTSFVDGNRYSNTYSDIQRMRNISDEICREHNLSVIENKTHKGKSRSQHFHERTLRSIVKEDVDDALSLSYYDKQFYRELELQGYEIKITNKNISVKHPLHDKFIRLKSLGDEYTNEGIREKLSNPNKTKSDPFYMFTNIGFDARPYYQKYEKRELSGLQKLYFHYLYILRIIPKNQAHPVNKMYRKEQIEALKKLDEISNQAQILCDNDINTLEELNDHKKKLTIQVESLITLRQQYRNKVRSCDSDEEKDELKAKAKQLTPSIRKLNEELKYCDFIEERSTHMKKYIDEINLNKSKRRTQDAR
ncbi:MAG: relaxase/mobilization nuclease domain-containing protein [Erysipelotrichaceae bacterium]|nr:relaxase/mobilization nuclease domain-containing protein [Erysipelotrichaceae bacterium]